jgi:serine phosphatase RsbU (regulator of sigma subunit)
VPDPVDVNEVDVELRAGETLLLYTDGLPEAGRAGLELDEERLFEVCAEVSEDSLGGALGRIERAALAHAGGRLRDDIALLALRVARESPFPLACDPAGAGHIDAAA